MPSAREALQAAGLWLGDDDDHPLLRQECARVARLVRERRASTLGLVPADDDVAIPAIAIELGSALADRSIRPVGVLDADASWTCAQALASWAAPDGTAMATSWILQNLAVLTPRSLGIGTRIGKLRAALAAKSGTFRHLVVDLTGFDHRGEQLAAYDILDAVALVARSGRTTIRQIERRLSCLPGGRGLGVLLTGL